MATDSKTLEDALDELTAKFWSKLRALKGPTWSDELEQLVNPNGDLRSLPPYVPTATGLDDKLVMACVARGLDPSDLDFVSFTDEDGNEVSSDLLRVRNHPLSHADFFLPAYRRRSVRSVTC